jgi:hypothetical protein
MPLRKEPPAATADEQQVASSSAMSFVFIVLLSLQIRISAAEDCGDTRDVNLLSAQDAREFPATTG